MKKETAQVSQEVFADETKCNHDDCSCGHDHGHDHGDECSCDHEHEHDHDHDHGHSETCSCGHDHDHGHDHGDECSCGHAHAHDHDLHQHDLSQTPDFTYHVLDIDCPHCAMTVQNAVRALPSVADARLVYATATLDVVMAEGATSYECRRQVLETVRSCGQDLELTTAETEELSAERSWYQQHRGSVLMSISGCMLLLGLVADHLLHNEAAAIPPYVLAAIAGLIFIAPMAWAALRRRTTDMNVLMGIAVIGGLAMGFAGDTSTFEDAAIVIFLAQVGEWLEGWSMRKTSGSIKELMNLAPDLAHVLDANDGKTITDIPVSDVEEGQHIRVMPGERVPLDGIILAGSSSFNEAAITGESTPKDKAVGDEVFAGALNTSGVVELEVTADEDCTMLARIVSMVQGAQAEKAPYESFVDRFAAVYTPLVVACAAAVGIAVPLVLSLFAGFTSTLWHDWVYRALSMLVVACPCALVISTPVSFVSAITRAAKNGVLVKGGAYFDIASKVTTMAFDKTGTLTTGNPAVVKVYAFGEKNERDVIEIAAALEESSTHPLARAVVAHARELGVPSLVATDVHEIAANGVKGMVQGAESLIGKQAFAAEKGNLAPEVDQAVSDLCALGATALVVMQGGLAIGAIGVADTMRPNAAQAMTEIMHAAKVNSLEMLTGDNRQAAEAIGKSVGMTYVVSELLPDGKVQYVRDMQEDGHVVAMVGDGINDAPALATADLAITMGAAASDTALEVADVALLSDDLLQLPRFLELSVRTMHVVTENICFAIIVKALVFVLVLLGVAGMGAAVFADTGVALLVILNGMRLMLDSRLRW